MSTLHIGCAGFSAPRSRYARKLAFVEIEVGRPAPAPKVLQRWAEEAGAAMVWSVMAPSAMWGERDWPLRDEKNTQAEIDRLVNVVKPLGARAVLLRTPPTIRPGTVAAKRFASVAERVRKMAPIVAWEPTGLWERKDAQALVKGLDVVVACDPLRDEIAGEAIVYARLRGLGGDRRYHQGRIEDIFLALEDVKEAFVVFETAQSFAEALRLRRLIEGAMEGDADEETDDEDDKDDEDDEEDREADDADDADDEDADDSDDDDDDDESDEDNDGDDDEDEG